MGSKYKDWTTTVRETRTKSVPAGLPSHLQHYFNNAFKENEARRRLYSSQSSSGRSGGHVRTHPHGSTYQDANGRVRPPRNEAAIHVSRNNPHPYRIFFPFQTGDRLSTYMVWLPLDKDQNPPNNNYNYTPHLPSINKPPAPYKMPESRCYKPGVPIDNPFPYQSTYQAEIAKMPVLKHKVMVDHFPDLAMGISRYSTRPIKVNR